MRADRSPSVSRGLAEGFCFACLAGGGWFWAVRGGRGHSFGHSGHPLARTASRYRSVRHSRVCWFDIRAAVRAGIASQPGSLGDSAGRVRRRCQNVGTSTTGTPSTDPRLRRSRSAVTSHSAAPATAHSRNLSSSGSRHRRIRREGVTSVTRRRSRAISARDSRTVNWSFRSTSGRRRTASTSARIGSDASSVNRPSSQAS
jgi:hypothetical protein